MASSVGRIVVLLWADRFAMYTMYMMMAYLTSVWNLGFTSAAAVLNVYWGLVEILPLLVQFLVDTVTGNYWMLLVSSIAYTTGFGFLTLSTLRKIMSTCTEYEPECTGIGHKLLFYTALAFMIIGMCGHLISWAPFIAQQVNTEEEEDTKDEAHSCNSFSNLTLEFVTLVAVIGLPSIKSWSVRFGIPVGFTLIGNLVFLSGSSCYKYVEPQGSPLTAFVRVCVASISKFGHSSPKDAKELHQGQNPDVKALPHTRSLRCLDKAAIIDASATLEEQQKNVWKLCTLIEVEETKTIIRMIPVWSTFTFCGIVSSIGFTYFIEQLYNLTSPLVGGISVPPILILLIYNLAKSQCNKLYVKFTNSSLKSSSRKFAPAIGVVVSMILGILCSICAAIVEKQRLNVVRTENLLDKPDQVVPMSMFWLLPQFLLLAALDGIFYSSAVTFFKDQSPSSTKNYIPFFIRGVFGVGILSSVLSVYIVGKFSEWGGKPNWFQYYLNRSRLDKYYWTLAWLSAINLVIFIVVAILYRYNESELQKVLPTEFAEPNEPFEDDSNCCCCCC